MKKKSQNNSPRLTSWASKKLDEGWYDDIDDLCNGEGLDYDDVFVYPGEDDD